MSRYVVTFAPNCLELSPMCPQCGTHDDFGDPQYLGHKKSDTCAYVLGFCLRCGAVWDVVSKTFYRDGFEATNMETDHWCIYGKLSAVTKLLEECALVLKAQKEMPATIRTQLLAQASDAEAQLYAVKAEVFRLEVDEENKCPIKKR